jgi:glycosyl hydrolase family 44
MRASWVTTAIFIPLTTLWSCAKSPSSGEMPTDASAKDSQEDSTGSAAHVDLTIDRSKLGRTISPLIYGYNSIADPAAQRVAALRAGGNRFTAYNWENNASNAGNDYMFQNDNYLVTGSTAPDAPGQAVRPMLETARRIGAAAVLTIPNVDYVAADKLGDGDVTKSGTDYLMTRFKANRPTAGATPSPTPDPTDGFVYQDEFVAWVKQNFADVPVLFSMDNEPDLWSSTHKDIHPLQVTYAELIQRNTDYARAVKAVMPTAPVLGPVSYGWQGYVTLQNAPDAGGEDFINHYLTKMQAAETTAGMRLIDYLDLHWYPEALGRGADGKDARIVFGAADTSPGMVDARVQAPRSLWDPDYREKSWIATNLGAPIALIPRMQKKIDDHYPGTKLAITEWNYGGGGDISGAVAAADVLGIFGREGVALANLWPIGPDTFCQAAIGLFRNYDGAGAQFGDTSVEAITTSNVSSSVYASIDSSNPSRLVIVAINKRADMTTATVRLTGDSAATAAVWVMSGTSPSIRAGAPLSTATPGTFSYDMPPLSISVLVPATP